MGPNGAHGAYRAHGTMGPMEPMGPMGSLGPMGPLGSYGPYGPSRLLSTAAGFLHFTLVPPQRGVAILGVGNIEGMLGKQQAQTCAHTCVPPAAAARPPAARPGPGGAGRPAGFLTFFCFSQNGLKRSPRALGGPGGPWGPYFPYFSPYFGPPWGPLGGPWGALGPPYFPYLGLLPY